jgi:hypothetical protein
MARKPVPIPTVGSRVRFAIGGRRVVGTVVEDRGNIGIEGRKLLRVRVELTGGAEPLEFEIPAADVSAAA